MKFYLGVTDNNWFKYLDRIKPEDVNFWELRSASLNNQEIFTPPPPGTWLACV